MPDRGDRVIHFKKNPFYRHEQILLASGSFEGFLPMSFLREENGLTARYQCSGFAPLSSYRIERTEDALYLMEKVVLILHAAPEHLLIPERILLRCQTVFFSKKDDRIKIAYVPRPRNDAAPGAGSISGFHRELILLLTQLKQDLRDGHADLLSRLIRDIYYHSLDTRSLLRQIGLLRKELYGSRDAPG